MDFDLNPAQQVVADLAAQVLTAHESSPQTAWKAMADAGLLALAVPERLGGDGLDAIATMVVLSETGRRAVAVPALATLALGVLPLVRWSGENVAEVLAQAASGELRLTAAMREPPAQRTAVGADGRITGVKVGVLDAEAAGRILVTATDVDESPVLLLVDPSAGGVHMTRTPSAGGLAEHTVRFDGALATLIGGVDAVDDLHRLALAAAAATGDGALAGALALTTSHVAQRVQFGRPLATFQAVAQQIADVAIVSRALHLAAVAAAWQVRTTGVTPNGDAEIAAHWLASRVPQAIRTCHHLHGGLGLDVTYPLHRHSALLRDLVRMVGGAEATLHQITDTAQILAQDPHHNPDPAQESPKEEAVARVPLSDG